eukprot:2891211-Rhodomonas_salina.2
MRVEGRGLRVEVVPCTAGRGHRTLHVVRTGHCVASAHGIAKRGGSEDDSQFGKDYVTPRSILLNNKTWGLGTYRIRDQRYCFLGHRAWVLRAVMCTRPMSQASPNMCARPMSQACPYISISVEIACPGTAASTQPAFTWTNHKVLI